jgi:hypothetical protein
MLFLPDQLVLLGLLVQLQLNKPLTILWLLVVVEEEQQHLLVQVEAEAAQVDLGQVQFYLQ